VRRGPATRAWRSSGRRAPAGISKSHKRTGVSVGGEGHTPRARQRLVLHPFGRRDARRQRSWRTNRRGPDSNVRGRSRRGPSPSTAPVNNRAHPKDHSAKRPSPNHVLPSSPRRLPRSDRVPQGIASWALVVVLGPTTKAALSPPCCSAPRTPPRPRACVWPLVFRAWVRRWADETGRTTPARVAAGRQFEETHPRATSRRKTNTATPRCAERRADRRDRGLHARSGGGHKSTGRTPPRRTGGRQPRSKRHTKDRQPATRPRQRTSSGRAMRTTTRPCDTSAFWARLRALPWDR